MRHTLIFLTVVLMLTACNNSGTIKTASDTDSTVSERPLLIKELKKLKEIIASNDKENIAGIFQFPLSDSAFGIYIYDSLYNEQLKENGNKTTKAMFLQHYKQIYPGIWLDQLNNLLQNIKIDSLLHKDTLQYDAYSKSEPCYYSYQIEVIKKDVTLTMNGKSNTDYKSKDTSEDDIPENSSEICEHSFWWVFSFDGKKLHFETISGAD